MTLRELPPAELPREKMLERGPEALADAELLAILMRTGYQGRNVVEVAGDLLREAGNLTHLARATLPELMAAKGLGPAKACELAAVFELARRVARERFTTERIDSPEAVHELMAGEMRALRQEALRVILLNTRHRLLRVIHVSLGSVNESIADMREILRPAIVHNAFAFILVHNHPSGDPSPSAPDRSLTRQVREAADLMRIRFLDHIIIGRDSPDHPAYFSFREAGLL